MSRTRIVTQLLTLVAIMAIAGIAIAQSTTRTAPATQDSGGSTEGAAPKVIAVKLHADWCGHCKQMGAAFEEMQAKFDQEPVLYITLDQTRDFGRKQSQYLAHTLGLDGVWKEHGGKTGFILLIDPNSRQVVQTLTHEQNLKQMGAALEEAVRNASTARPATGREHPEHPAKKADHPDHPR